METKQTPSIHIVRIINKESNPMVGVTCPDGVLGMTCWDPYGRKYNPHTQILIDKETNNIIGTDK